MLLLDKDKVHRVIHSYSLFEVLKVTASTTTRSTTRRSGDQMGDQITPGDQIDDQIPTATKM